MFKIKEIIQLLGKYSRDLNTRKCSIYDLLLVKNKPLKLGYFG